MFESDLDNAFENKYAPMEEIPEEGAVALAGKKSKETITATDSIIDALDIAEVELKRIAEHEVCLVFCSIISTSLICSLTLQQNLRGISIQFSHHAFQEEKSKGKVAELQPNVVLLGLSPSDYVLRALSNVQTNDLEQTLLVCLSFSLHGYSLKQTKVPYC